MVDDSEYAAALRRTMEQLPRTFRRPVPIDDLLNGVTAAAVDLIDGADCADVLLIGASDDFRSLAPTRQLAVDVDNIQERFREGPCLDAAEGDALVRCNDLHDDPRWPQFAQGAIELGVQAMMSFQIYTDDNRKGALNLFGLQPAAFTAKDQAVGAMLATHAATALIAHDRERQFQAALASRDVIGQAKGMIMERFTVDAAQAFELLKKLSQDSNTSVVDIAAGLVARGPEPKSRS
ncbi:MAG TPA: GAF and ANTAR domain-containing protein [Mycobacterium sp.]|nr:GAF and ANTAR domain-containing protein [Mycobacterium sp.]